MLQSLRRLIAPRLRAMRRAGDFPILLPHFGIENGLLHGADGSERRLPARLAAALSLCDGSRSLAQVVAGSGAGRVDLMRLHDEGRIILWREKLDHVKLAPIERVIFSPHPDDAALSLGGMMLSCRPGSVCVMTIFGRSLWCRFDNPPLDALHIQHIRLEEERLMAQLTGVTLELLDLPEAMLRGYSREEIFGHGRGDRAVFEAVREHVLELAGRCSPSQWYLPLGAGNHIDHILVRDAALSALRQRQTPPHHILFYEEMPYAAEMAERPALDGERPSRMLKFPIGQTLPWKLELLRVYWSQLTWSRIAAIGHYARTAGNNERCWMMDS